MEEKTQDQLEDNKEKLDDKTGQLEKRLLLRQFITRALQIKRAETAELVRGDNPEGLPPKLAIMSSSNSIQNSSQKLTFYDVVQLARQRALAEKTRNSSEDSVELSDTLLLATSQAPSTTVQSNHALLESSSPTALQQIDPSLLSQNAPGTSTLNQNPELTSNQSGSPELDTALSQKPSGVNEVELVDLQDSQAVDRPEEETSKPLASAAALNKPHPLLDQCSAALNNQGSNTTEALPAPEPVGLEASQAGDSDAQEASDSFAPPASLNQSSLPMQQSSTTVIGQENNTDEAPADVSPTSTAAPSIFSHSSTLSSATGSTLPGITEEDVKARNPSSQTSLNSSSITPISSPPLVRRKILGSGRPSISKNQVQGIDAELNKSSSTSSTPTLHLDSELPSKPQRTNSEDSVSQLSLPPLISNIDEPDKKGFPWIVQAARDGNEEMVQKLLVSGADIKASHATTRRHALSEASIQGHKKIVDLLIEEGCPLDYPDAEGYTALHHACQKGHLAVAKSLITNGALIDAPGPQGQTALYLAIQVPHQNVVMLLVQHKASVYARDASFRTPLHIGASQGNVAMCSYLLNEGAQLDSREAQSKTPLQLACEVGHYELVQMMLNQSNLNPTSLTFLTAFFAAVEHGHIRIAESFFERGLKLQELEKDSYKPATLAAKSGSLDMVELMIKENCDINAKDENEWNALHFASYYGHYQVIERLMANGVCTTAITSRKETPLLFAVKEDHFPVTERLLRSNKDGNLVSAEDELGQKPIHHTARTGSIEIFNLLMSNGAKINVENSFGWQPLHIATAYGHLTVVQRLLQQGANVEEKLSSSSIKKDQTHKIVEDGCWAEARWPYPGSRPLHLACEYGHYQIASHLISKGAKMEATCSEGWQPLHHAAYIGSSALVEMLLGAGVYPHATTNEGKTAQGLQFCTGGVPILEDEKERVRNLLREAMDKAKKQKSFKVALKRGGTVEEKNNLVRAATFSTNIVSRPQTHRAITTMTTSDPPSTNSHRPPLPHLSQTSPLPLTHSNSILSPQSPPTPNLPVSQPESKPLTQPIAANPDPQNTNKQSSEALVAESATDQPPRSSDTSTLNVTPGSNTEMQVSVEPRPKIKRKSTLGLSKVKPGIEIGKLGLGSIGKQTFEIGKQTFDIGKQTLEIGKQGIEIGKQGIEMGKQGIEIGKQGIEIGKQGLDLVQGLEMGKQGLDIGRQGFDIGKQGYKKAKKFAKKGKSGSGKMGLGKRTRKSKLSNGIEGTVDKDVDTTVDNKLKSVFNNDNGLNNDSNDDDDDDDDGSMLDDAVSVFSLGDFADLGNDDF